MKRGVVKKSESTLLTVWVPKNYFPLIARGVRQIDSDRSKFVRAAIREKLERHGVAMTVEVEP